MAVAKITTLTPVHVGSGTTYNRNIDFVEEGGRIGIVDANKVAELIGSNKEAIDQWVKAIEKETPLMDFLRSNRGKKEVNIDNISDRVCIVLESSSAVSTLREQIRSAFEGAYLPGSSMKGAIRTAILNRLILNSPANSQNFSIFKEEKKDRNTGKVFKISFKGVALEKKYFGVDANHDIMRMIRIGDAHFGDTVCMLAKTLNERGNGHEIKDNVTQLIECVPANEEALCQISIHNDLIKQIKLPKFQEVANKMRGLPNVENWKEIFKQINDHNWKQIDIEIVRYKLLSLPNEASGFVPRLQELKSEISQLSDNECIIRVGFGTGYRSMTGGWALEHWENQVTIDYAKEIKDLANEVRHKGGYEGMALPKSRKIGYEGEPLGFVKISLMSEEQGEEWRNKTATRRVEFEKKRASVVEFFRIKKEKEAEEFHLAEAEAKKLKSHPGPISKGLEVDAEVLVSSKPSKVKIFVNGYEGKLYDLVDSAQQPIGYICRVALVIEKGKILRVKHLRPK